MGEPAWLMEPTLPSAGSMKMATPMWRRHSRLRLCQAPHLGAPLICAQRVIGAAGEDLNLRRPSFCPVPGESFARFRLQRPLTA
jgi:hypothetical protein